MQVGGCKHLGGKTISLSRGLFTVLDHVSQVRDIVLMSVYLEVRSLGGSGFWNEGLMSKGREMGSSVYKQSETKVDGSCHSKESSK
jgi:hypothetical protein